MHKLKDETTENCCFYKKKPGYIKFNRIRLNLEIQRDPIEFRNSSSFGQIYAFFALNFKFQNFKIYTKFEI